MLIVMFNLYFHPFGANNDYALYSTVLLVLIFEYVAL